MRLHLDVWLLHWSPGIPPDLVMEHVGNLDLAGVPNILHHLSHVVTHGGYLTILHTDRFDLDIVV